MMHVLYVGGVYAHVCTCGARGGHQVFSSITLLRPSEPPLCIPHNSAVTGTHVAMGAEGLSSDLHSCTARVLLPTEPSHQPLSMYVLFDFKDKA